MKKSNPDDVRRMEQRARTETPSALNLWTKDGRKWVNDIARAELERREREASQRESLTGVVEPL